MKHLVECPHCRIQYDATGRAVGSQFRCHCGHAVAVTNPQTDFHLQIVRCCNCGGGREDSRPHCSFCGAEFTLSARDLEVICPHCTERTGKRSKFCHLCGTAIEPSEIIGETGDLPCPRCDHSRLSIRQLGGGIAIQECDSCLGIWLPKVIFALLEARSIDAGRLITPSLDLGDAKNLAQTRPLTRYVSCPVCSTIMNRMNYQRVSGVIIDVCVRDGIWFDAGELAEIIVWLSKGGQQIAAAKAPSMEAEKILAEHRDRLANLQIYDDNRSSLSATSGVVQGDLLMAALELGGMLVGKLFK